MLKNKAHRDTVRFKDEISDLLAFEAEKSGFEVDPSVEDRIWRRIQLQTQKQSRFRNPSNAVFGTAIGLVCAAALALFIVYQQPDANYDGVKSGSNHVIPQIKALSFVAVNGSDVQQGFSGMKLGLGTKILFNVEAENVSAEHAVPVSILYQRGDTQGKITDYSLTKPQEILRGDEGYISFAPEQTGRYQITLEAGPGSKEIKLNGMGIEFEVVP